MFDLGLCMFDVAFGFGLVLFRVVWVLGCLIYLVVACCCCLRFAGCCVWIGYLSFGLIVFVFSFAVMGVVWFVLGLGQCVLPL